MRPVPEVNRVEAKEVKDPQNTPGGVTSPALVCGVRSPGNSKRAELGLGWTDK